MNSKSLTELHQSALTILKDGGASELSDAIRILQRAGTQGYVPSMIALGELYNAADASRKRDLPNAIRWYKMAADAGDAGGMWALSRLLLETKAPSTKLGEGISLKTIMFYAPLGGFGPLDPQIANLYRQGESAAIEEAQSLVRSAAALGHAQALAELAELNCPT